MDWDWEEKELEVANILVEMANAHILPDKPHGSNANASETQQQRKSNEKSIQRIRIIISPKQPQRTPAPARTSNNAGFQFQFPIVNFLSAVRVALITPTPTTVVDSPTTTTTTTVDSFRNKLLPSLTFDQIMQRVRSSPGDSRVFEIATEVRLQDLLRGALRILLSSSPPPPGNSWWRPLVVYQMNVKHWSWIGPLSSQWPQSDSTPTSPQAWGMSGRILNWLVDRFKEWLNSTQGVLQRIARLPPPPLTLMPQIPPGRRYQNNRNLKYSNSTIGPSCEAVKAYFRREESLRYSIPGQAFSYTTRDGRKSTVVPLMTKYNHRKLAKKPREHSVLKPDRPPYFTVLCMVRDAAARLPNRSGTRSDICALVRDSQFVVENATEDDITQVVIGALDRLASECDPCVSYDKYHRLWYYLHGDNEEEDFHEHPTLSRKRIKKLL